MCLTSSATVSCSLSLFLYTQIYISLMDLFEMLQQEAQLQNVTWEENQFM